MKRFRLALLMAALMLTTVLGAAPALADTSSVDWNFSGGMLLALGDNEIATLALADPAGSECELVLEVTNNPGSIHPGHTLFVYEGALGGTVLAAIPGFEDQPGTMTASASFVSTGETLFVSIFRTDDRKTSSSGILTVTCEPPDNGGGEGCTPGYWKQPHHFDSWVATGYAPTDSFDAVFGVDSDFGTLLDGVSAKGGQDNALARHAVAALLNSSNPDVSYEFSSAEVIALVQEAFATGNWNFYKDQLEYENEMGCPLN